MTTEKMFHVGVKALIEDKDGKVLLLHSPGWAKNNTPPHWDIPGGRIQEGQSVTEALEREVEEETGVTKLESNKFFTAVIAKHEIPFESHVLGLVLMVYKVQIPDDSKITLSHEHTDYEWVDKKQAGKRLANKYPAEFTDLL
jgi:8-oxo-dGTP diphosphatase